MRIFDVPKGWRGATPPLRIAVHGSCRVHDPFEELASNGELIKVWANNYAVSYTLAEAHQMLCFSIGESEIPTHLLPFIFDDARNAFTPNGWPRDVIKDVDVFVVEASELRQVRYREFFFQIQVFMRNFVSKYGAALLPWYRAFSLGQPISEEIVSDALAGLPSSVCREDRAVIESVLREVRLEEVSLGTTKQLIEKLKANAVDKWIFVSHFQVPGLSGTLMADRGKLQEIMRQATAECGVDFFDPTEIVARYGRQRMLANNGADIYHYNPDNQFVVAEALLKLVYLKENEKGHLPEKARITSPPKCRPLQTVSAALNALLVPFHRERLARLGIDDSGLHAHYALLLERGIVVGERDLEVANVVLRFLPQFEHYHVFRAGLGEIAFLLAAFGSPTVGFDPFSGRFSAMVEGWKYLQACGLIGNDFDAKNEIVPETEENKSTLGVATQLLLTVSAAQREAILVRLESYDAILFDPSMLIDQRPDPREQEKLITRLRDAGFAYTRPFPQQRLMYCAKLGMERALVTPR